MTMMGMVMGLGMVRRKGGNVPEKLGAVAWWDHREGVAIDTGVSAWTDRISGIALSQGTAGSQPGYTAGQIVFDGTDDYLATTSNTVLAAETSREFTIACKGSTSGAFGADETRTAWGFGGTTLIYHYAGLSSYLSSPLDQLWRVAVRGTGASATVFDSDVDAFAAESVYAIDGTSARLLVNGSSDSYSAPVQPVPATTFTVGSLLYNGSVVSYWNGPIDHVVLFNRALSEAESALLESWMDNL